MPIYKGSTKIGKIYYGSTKIGKVYKGSTLVYSGGEEIIPITKILQSTYSYSIVGNLEPNKTYASDSTNFTHKLQSINGTIGESGSTITTFSDTAQFSTELKFNKQITDSNGRLFYVYYTIIGTYVDFVVSISPKQKIGDKVPIGSYQLITTNSNATSFTGISINGYTKSFSIDTNTVIDYYTYRK